MLEKTIKNLLDIIFPQYCLGCQKEGISICGACFKKIEINNISNCYICGAKTPENETCKKCKKQTNIDKLLIAGKWDDLLLRQIIYEYKYRFIKDLSTNLSKTLLNYINSYHKTLINNNTILIPVPLFKRRLSWRGFNQSELLAKQLSEYLSIHAINLIQRHKPTLPQVEIKNSKIRKNNVFKAFSLVNPLPVCKDFENKTFILIDDVCTTGATLEECANTLKPLRAKEIWGLVLARG